MTEVLFSISALQSEKYKKCAKLIDFLHLSLDNNIDSNEIKNMIPLILSDFKSKATDKRNSFGHPKVTEFDKELKDLIFVFDALPYELKQAVRDKLNKNKPKLSKEQEAKQKEECERAELRFKAKTHGVDLPEEYYSSLTIDQLKAIVNISIWDDMSPYKTFTPGSSTPAFGHFPYNF